MASSLPPASLPSSLGCLDDLPCFGETGKFRIVPMNWTYRHRPRRNDSRATPAARFALYFRDPSPVPKLPRQGCKLRVNRVPVIQEQSYLHAHGRQELRGILACLDRASHMCWDAWAELHAAFLLENVCVSFPERSISVHKVCNSMITQRAFRARSTWPLSRNILFASSMTCSAIRILRAIFSGLCNWSLINYSCSHIWRTHTPLLVHVIIQHAPGDWFRPAVHRLWKNPFGLQLRNHFATRLPADVITTLRVRLRPFRIEPRPQRPQRFKLPQILPGLPHFIRRFTLRNIDLVRNQRIPLRAVQHQLPLPNHQAHQRPPP